MRFSDEKTKKINMNSLIDVGTKRLLVYNDGIWLMDKYGNSDYVCKIEHLANLQDACKALRESIATVADVWY